MKIEFVYIARDGDHHSVSASCGDTLMEVAINHGVFGVDGDCGGCCACGTCRIIFDATVDELAGSPGEDERDLLESAANDASRERLGCQIKVDERFAGRTIRVAQA